MFYTNQIRCISVCPDHVIWDVSIVDFLDASKGAWKIY